MEHVNTQKYRQDRSVVAGTNTPERGRRESKVVSPRPSQKTTTSKGPPVPPQPDSPAPILPDIT